MYNNNSRGFTLVELLVVVSLLATMAGIAVSSVADYNDRARGELVLTEMKRISNAVLKFKQDTGYFPRQGQFSKVNTRNANLFTENKADLSFLFYSPKRGNNEILPWDNSAMRGWNGPYLSSDSIQYAQLNGCDTDLALNSIKIKGINSSQSNEQNSFIALEDTYEKKHSEKTSSNCFISKIKGSWKVKQTAGKAYIYDTVFRNNLYPECPETGRGCIVLLSAGKNGVYNNGGQDDIVHILRVN